jgi:hypothetical protein
MPILDGKPCKPEEIDPAKHRFIGMFRPPTWPRRESIGHLIDCPCTRLLGDTATIREHWRDGHFDEPQYINIVQEDVL